MRARVATSCLLALSWLSTSTGPAVGAPPATAPVAADEQRVATLRARDQSITRYRVRGTFREWVGVTDATPAVERAAGSMESGGAAPAQALAQLQEAWARFPSSGGTFHTVRHDGQLKCEVTRVPGGPAVGLVVNGTPVRITSHPGSSQVDLLKADDGQYLEMWDFEELTVTANRILANKLVGVTSGDSGTSVTTRTPGGQATTCRYDSGDRLLGFDSESAGRRLFKQWNVRPVQRGGLAVPAATLRVQYRPDDTCIVRAVVFETVDLDPGPGAADVAYDVAPPVTVVDNRGASKAVLELPGDKPWKVSDLIPLFDQRLPAGPVAKGHNANAPEPGNGGDRRDPPDAPLARADSERGGIVPMLIMGGTAICIIIAAMFVSNRVRRRG